jgi:hypothetical protein
MSNKVCTGCNVEKSTELFNKKKAANDGFDSRCKSCRKNYRMLNKEKISKRNREFREKNKNYFKEYYLSNKDSIDEYRSSYKSSNSDAIREYNREYSKLNSDKIKKYQEEYRIDNKESLKITKKSYYQRIDKYVDRGDRSEYMRNYVRERRSNDNLFRVSCNIRTAISNSISNRGMYKSVSTEEILGISLHEFMLYIESKSEKWMNWDNYGIYDGEFGSGWDIDHIIPVSSALTESDLIQLNHYTNLQPLCSKENRDIKRNSL